LFFFCHWYEIAEIDRRSYAENQLHGAEFEFAPAEQDQQAGRPDRMVYDALCILVQDLFRELISTLDRKRAEMLLCAAMWFARSGVLMG